MSPARHRRPPPPLLVRALAVGAVIGIFGPPLVLAEQASPVDPRPSAAAVLSVVEQPDPTARASGIRSPVRTTAPQTSEAPASTPDVVDDPRPTTETRACRCAPRSDPPAPTTAAASSTVTAEPPTQEPEPDADNAQPAATVGLLELVNRDRVAAGCGPVTIHPDLMGQSQAHADAQAADDSMYHSPGVAGFGTWGENVAAGYDTAAAVHDAWMASTGHRANILNCAYTFMGAAAADSATGVRYWTEQFAA